MSSGNEFHSTGPAHEKDRRSYRSRLWRGTHTTDSYRLILDSREKRNVLLSETRRVKVFHYNGFFLHLTPDFIYVLCSQIFQMLRDYRSHRVHSPRS